ncbi:Uncharacterised protein [Acinetobacter baumannii]|nr:Uncharacterised protein [Acinetobacter baumannii]
MHMHANQLQAIAADLLHRLRQIGIPDAVFTVLTTGVGFLAVAVAKPRINAQPHRMSGGSLAELIQHIDGTCVDRDLQCANARQRRMIQYVRGKHDIARLAARLKTGLQRPLDFAERHRIHLHALLAHQAQNMNVRTGFLRETDSVEVAQLSDALADDVGIISPDRATEALRQGQQVSGVQRGGGVVQRAWHGDIPNSKVTADKAIVPHAESGGKYLFSRSLFIYDIAFSTVEQPRHAQHLFAADRNLSGGDDHRQPDRGGGPAANLATHRQP